MRMPGITQVQIAATAANKYPMFNSALLLIIVSGMLSAPPIIDALCLVIPPVINTAQPMSIGNKIIMRC